MGDDVREFTKSVKQSIKLRWIDLYHDQTWIKREITKAMNWCEINPKRKPRSNIARFLANWLERAYEQHRKTIPTRQANTRPQPPLWIDGKKYDADSGKILIEDE